MTTEQFLLKMLTDRGMSDFQADEVLAICKPLFNSIDRDYQITWDRPYNEYPEIMYSLWWNTLREKALIWLNENKPQAWFKPMFEG